MTVTTLGLNSPPTFLGAYIKHISANTGFSSNPSSITVTLAEDPQNGFAFQHPEVGRYYTVEVGNNWSFGGIITKYDLDLRNVGGRFIRINISDPRQIMSNLPVIINPGSSAIIDGVRNTNCKLIDVFGAFSVDAQAWNFSGWTQAGMPYRSFSKAISGGSLTIGNFTFSFPQQTVNILGDTYSFDLSEVDNYVSGDFLINTNFSPLSSVIEDIAQKNSFDWFVESSVVNNTIVVTVKVIDRKEDNIELSLQEFLDDHPEKVITATSGVELKTDSACAVLLGAAIESIKRVPIAGLANEPLDLSQESGSAAYLMTEDEMRAVLGGKQSWEAWITIPAESGGGGGFSRYGGTLLDSYAKTIIPNLADVQENVSVNNLFKNKNRKTRDLQTDFSEVVGKVYEKLSGHATSTYGKRFVHEDVFDEIIESCWTRDATSFNNNPLEYFRQEDGRTRAFVEFLYGAPTGVINVISTPRESFGDSVVFRNITSYGKTFENTGVEPNNAIIRMENDVLDPTNYVIKMDKSHYTYEAASPTTSIFVACTIDKDGVVRIESPITEKTLDPSADDALKQIINIAESDTSNYLLSKLSALQEREESLAIRQRDLNAEIDELLDGTKRTLKIRELDRVSSQRTSVVAKISAIQARINGGNEVNNEDVIGVEADGNQAFVVSKIAQNIASVVGPGFTISHPKAYQPVNVYIPTRSRYLRYGPIFPSRINEIEFGRLEVIQDDGFAPWEFGSISLMALAMQAKVDNIASAQKELFSGTIAVESYPKYTLGQAVDRNSNISSISMTFSTDGGCTTTYQLQSYTRKFGELTKEDWATIALFLNSGGARILPERLTNFMSSYNVPVNKQPLNGNGGNPMRGGAFTFG